MPENDRMTLVKECIEVENGNLAQHGGRLYEGLKMS
jgi:hypothetical protein